MLFAIDKDGNRVYIDDASKSEEYFCPVCKQRLIIKRGLHKIHHFAHQANSNCTDTWHEDMSAWHMHWQSLFPHNTQEIVKCSNNIFHRADVLVESSKVVFEFQHSPLSSEEFNDRNNFYNSLGYKVIWVFDLSKEYDDLKINMTESKVYKWSYSKKTFYGFNPKENKGKVEIYFQFVLNPDENETLKAIKEKVDFNYYVTDDDEQYYKDHRNDHAELIKVTWCSVPTFDRFASDGYCYSEDDIVNLYKELDPNNSHCYRLSDLSDNLIEIFSKGHATYYSSCPLCSSHVCASSGIDIPSERYGEIMVCSDCDYFVYDDLFRRKCKQRFMSLGLPGNAEVRILKRDKHGSITKISYFDKGIEVVKDLPIFNPGKTLLDLWKDSYVCASFVNLFTGAHIRINNDPRIQVKKYGTVKGYLLKQQFSTKGEWCDVFGYNKPEWICTWSRDK